jgi:lipopolysaccharide/colanic/teichoic acid biosynthesis glycosyltransferase
MNRRAGLPPISFTAIAVALASATVLFPYFSGELLSRFETVRVTVADAIFSAIFAVCWLYAASWVRLYGGRLRWYIALVRWIQCYGPVAALLAVYIVVFHPNVSAFRTTTVFVICILLCESLWMVFCNLSHSSARRALVLGTGRVATTVWRDLRTGRLPELSFAGFTSERFGHDACPDIAARYVGDLSELKEIVLQQSVDDLIVTTPAAEASSETEHAVEVAANLGVRVWTVRQALGVPGCASKDISTEYIELVGDPDLSEIRRLLKRSLDLTLSATILVACSPVALSILMNAKLTGHKLRFQNQARVGLHRRLFYIHRLSSTFRPDWLLDWMNHYLLLWNVLRGDMSMVGPHALTPEDLSIAEVPESAGRFGIRPGIAGAWVFDVRRNSTGDSSGAGIDYADRWSPITDLRVLARAVVAFARRCAATRVETGAL